MNPFNSLPSLFLSYQTPFSKRVFFLFEHKNFQNGFNKKIFLKDFFLGIEEKSMEPLVDKFKEKELLLRCGILFLDKFALKILFVGEEKLRKKF